MPPALITLLPKDGFRWESYSKKLFLKGHEQKLIAHALCQAHSRAKEDPEVVVNFFALMFEIATDKADDCASTGPATFWREVGDHLSWVSNKITGETLYNLSKLAMSARYFKLDDADFLEEFEKISPEEAKEMRSNTRLMRAVDSFVHTIHEKYGMSSHTQEVFVPKYTQCSHNEGTTEATFGELTGMYPKYGPDALSSAAMPNNQQRQDEDVEMEWEDDNEEDDYGEEYEDEYEGGDGEEDVEMEDAPATQMEKLDIN
ncbi:hypothetical protein F5Y16DRAFT_403359 [Xylariaceae sp. FL0255]|nr:hypothetical protein F5Y16DRAFT_403359 [Xylariaceae sp. FL0255]